MADPIKAAKDGDIQAIRGIQENGGLTTVAGPDGKRPADHARTADVAAACDAPKPAVPTLEESSDTPGPFATLALTPPPRSAGFASPSVGFSPPSAPNPYIRKKK